MIDFGLARDFIMDRQAKLAQEKNSKKYITITAIFLIFLLAETALNYSSVGVGLCKSISTLP